MLACEPQTKLATMVLNDSSNMCELPRGCLSFRCRLSYGQEIQSLECRYGFAEDTASVEPSKHCSMRFKDPEGSSMPSCRISLTLEFVNVTVNRMLINVVHQLTSRKSYLDPEPGVKHGSSRRSEARMFGSDRKLNLHFQIYARSMWRPTRLHDGS